MKGLSIALSLLLLLGVQQLAAYLKRSGLAPAQRARPELPVRGDANSATQRVSRVLHA